MKYARKKKSSYNVRIKNVNSNNIFKKIDIINKLNIILNTENL